MPSCSDARFPFGSSRPGRAAQEMQRWRTGLVRPAVQLSQGKEHSPMGKTPGYLVGDAPLVPE